MKRTARVIRIDIWLYWLKVWLTILSRFGNIEKYYKLLSILEITRNWCKGCLRDSLIVVIDFELIERRARGQLKYILSDTLVAPPSQFNSILIIQVKNTLLFHIFFVLIIVFWQKKEISNIKIKRLEHKQNITKNNNFPIKSNLIISS